jgi:threonine synthase
MTGNRPPDHTSPNPPPAMNPRLRGLRCAACGKAHTASHLQTTCTDCELPLLAEYALEPGALPPASLIARPPSLWRYAEVLPIAPESAVTLVEGFTPLVPAGEDVWIKDEARNPTGSFKARGMSVAVSMAKALGARALVAPSAGNAAAALAAYGAASGLPVTVAMPEDTPPGFAAECRQYGAQVELVPGTIADAGRHLRAHGPPDAFDVSTLREPYRVEGKKTMAYELYEQMESRLPDVIVYPTGGGTGLVGIWKAFSEMAALGWIGPARPRLVSVQAAGCAPVVRAFEGGDERTVPWPDPETRAYGLRVPAPIAGFICLRALRETGGTALAIPEAAIAPAAAELARATGLDICPETGAAWVALNELRARGLLTPGERAVVFNTGAGTKYRV